MMVRQAHHDSARFIIALTVLTVLSGCSSSVTGQVHDTLSGALAPVKGAIDEAVRRTNEVGEGINEVQNGIQKVQGALSGSGSRF